MSSPERGCFLGHLLRLHLSSSPVRSLFFFWFMSQVSHRFPVKWEPAWGKVLWMCRLKQNQSEYKSSLFSEFYHIPKKKKKKIARRQSPTLRAASKCTLQTEKALSDKGLTSNYGTELGTEFLTKRVSEIPGNGSVVYIVGCCIFFNCCWKKTELLQQHLVHINSLCQTHCLSVRVCDGVILADRSYRSM